MSYNALKPSPTFVGHFLRQRVYLRYFIETEHICLEMISLDWYQTFQVFKTRAIQ